MGYHYRFISGYRVNGSTMARTLDIQSVIDFIQLRQAFTFSPDLSLVDEDRFANHTNSSPMSAQFLTQLLKHGHASLALRFNEAEFFAAASSHELLKNERLIRQNLLHKTTGVHSEIAKPLTAQRPDFNLETQWRIFWLIVALPLTSYVFFDSSGSVKQVRRPSALGDLVRC